MNSTGTMKASLGGSSSWNQSGTSPASEMLCISCAACMLSNIRYVLE